MSEQDEDAPEAQPELRDDAMTRFPVPSYDDLPEDLRERIATETAEAGFTPNVFAAFAYAPEQFRAFFEFYDAIESGALAREEVEMIVVAVSGRNHCYYCNVAHGALVRLYTEDPTLADQLVANYRAADLPERHRVMLDVAVTLTDHPDRFEAADVERLYDAGFSEREAWEVAAVTAFFNLSNRMATFADMRPNDEFHAIGR
jgi:uncharacterized peroxidase-related enzyme